MGAVIPLFITFIGAVACLGWVVDSEVIKSLLPNEVTMKFTTALSLISSGLLFFFVRTVPDPRPLWQKYIAVLNFYALLLLILGILIPVMVQRLPYDVDAVKTVSVGRPSIGSMICFAIVATAGLVAIVHEFNAVRLRCTLGAILTMIGFLATFGYIVEQPDLYWNLPGKSTAMALHTAVCFVLLGFVLLTTPFRGYYEKGTGK